jgi:glycosyltransferase involved in cell wall biosynthesis
MPSAVSLIITTYNWPEALDLCLRSVARQTRLPDQVIVADDGSGESTRALMARWMAQAQLPLEHCWQEDLGFRLNRSRNNGIRAARSPYVVLLDSDMIVDRHFIADHLQAARAGQFNQGTRVRIGQEISARMLAQAQLDVPLWQPGLKDRQHLLRSPALARCFTGTDQALARIKGCNQGYWRADLEAVNGFNEAFVGWGPDDQEIAARLFQLGLQKRYLRFTARALHLHHKESAMDAANQGFALLRQTQQEKLVRCAQGLTPAVAETVVQ